MAGLDKWEQQEEAEAPAFCRAFLQSFMLGKVSGPGVRRFSIGASFPSLQLVTSGR